MLRVLVTLIPIALAIFCLIDVGMSSGDGQVRLMPRWAWVLVIVLFPIIGPLAWLFAGRPANKPQGGLERPGGGPVRPAPDDDPAFLGELERRRQQTQREELRKWQEDLERRERDYRHGNGSNGDDDGPATPRG